MTSKPIVVGIDGSEAAIKAAEWATDEAINRNGPVRLIYVMKANHPSMEAYQLDLESAETALRAAQSAVEAIGKPVKIETVIESGLPSVKLISASVDADMVCVGSTGIGSYARALLGSTVADVAEKARCTTAVIRASDEQPRADINWVVVALNDDPDNGAVADFAMGEGALRKAPVLAIGTELQHLDHALERRVEMLRRRNPDVHVYPVATEEDIAGFLEDNLERVQLVVIGGSDADEVARIVGPHGHPVYRHAQSSVVVVRG
ncbi:universal stress protein [Mycobacterium sp. 3519A]|uniref:universal stress protein n=1 Tax=Mycobacterium sp. 3519A TaxID=2057184 RepID=UPI000C7D0188|nr:universal stress protein [Mycobacterium sp. 3519A]